jgi:hypothetical protein
MKQYLVILFWICITFETELKKKELQLVLLWAQLTKLYPPLPTSVQPISITKLITDCSDQKWKGSSSLHR